MIVSARNSSCYRRIGVQYLQIYIHRFLKYSSNKEIHWGLLLSWFRCWWYLYIPSHFCDFLWQLWEFLRYICFQISENICTFLIRFSYFKIILDTFFIVQGKFWYIFLSSRNFLGCDIFLSNLWIMVMHNCYSLIKFNSNISYKISFRI